MGLQNEKIEALSFVRADLNYWAASSERPRTYAYEPVNGEPKTNIVPEPRALPIYDARPIPDTVSLDKEGFALVRQSSGVKDFYDDEDVKNIYYPGAERILKEVTGASRVFVFDHTVRKRAKDGGRSDEPPSARGACSCRSHRQIWTATRSRPHS